jgi:hypothetical protein
LCTRRLDAMYKSARSKHMRVVPSQQDAVDQHARRAEEPRRVVSAAAEQPGRQVLTQEVGDEVNERERRANAGPRSNDIEPRALEQALLTT